MKLLYVLENYWPHVGGMETLMGELCRRMALRGHDVTVVTRSLPNAPKHEARDGVDIVRVASPGGRFAFPLVALPEAVRLARESDLVHTTTFSAAPLGSLVGRLTRTPVVLTVPELWIGKWRAFSDAPLVSRTLYDLLERLVFLFPFDAYVGISRYTSGRLRTYLRSRANRVHSIYCGFDATPWRRSIDRASTRSERNFSEADFLIVGYGRPGMSKGFRYLVDAFPEIASAIPEARLLLVLSDSAATARELQKLKVRADPRIVFERPLGLEKLANLVGSADCVVIPSLAEGFGYTTLEAATSGTPIVVNETTSIPEVLGGRYAIAEPRNVASIVRAVERIRDGLWLDRPVPEFEWTTTVADYEAVYRRVASNGSKKKLLT